MTKIQIVKVANSLEMFRIYFFDIGIYLSFIHCHLEFLPKKSNNLKTRA